MIGNSNLTRIPPSDLLREVLALVVHEVTHMGGADEPEAKAWQQEFSDYFGQRFGDISDDITGPTFQKLQEARRYLAKAQRHYDHDSTDERISGDLGTMAGVLESLPYFNDPIAIKLKMNPPHPELIGPYTEAVSAIIASVKVNFQDCTPSGKPIPSSPDASWIKICANNLALAQKYASAISDYSKDIDRTKVPSLTS